MAPLFSRLARLTSFTKYCHRQLTRWQRFRLDYGKIARCGCFDRQWYLARYPDVKQSGADPLTHFLRFGSPEGRKPNSSFETSLYLQKHPELIASGQNPLLHFLESPSSRSGNCSYPPKVTPLKSFSIEQCKEATDVFAQSALQAFFAGQQKLAFPAYKQPTVSILIALYNRCELTLLCLQSILANCRCPYELVLIDNASTDSTSELLNRLENVTVERNSSNAGFVHAVNQAAALARGKHLLLLNNDAQLLGDAVTNAVNVLESSPENGAVGGRVLLPDAMLQEAGCTIWNDGSGSGYGRGGLPDSFEYMFRRTVDFCSGVFLLTRKADFDACGGLDTRFSPAYCEEIDYCIQLAKGGKRVVFDPDVAVLHYEFASSKNAAAALALQQKNRSVLVEKHKSWLSRKYSPAIKNSLAARSPATGQRVLIIDDRVPVAEAGAGAPRANAIVRAVCRHGASVTVYPTQLVNETWQNVYAALPAEVEVALGCGPENVGNFLRQRQGYYDLVLVSRPHNMQVLSRELKRYPSLLGGATLVYDAEAVFSLREVARRNLQSQPPAEQDAGGLLEEEMAITRGADLVVSVSEGESAVFRQYGINAVTLGHALTPQPTASSFEQRQGLLFVGPTSNPQSPNADSVQWLATEVLPLTTFASSAAPVRICGDCDSRTADMLVSHGLEVLGQVRDLTHEYDAARVFVAPTRFAAGIPLKIYEAAGRGLPVVATSLLAKQLGWRHEVELLVADTASDFAQAIQRLHDDAQLWNTIRSNALLAVHRDCSISRFDDVVAEILSHARRTGGT